MNKTVLETSAPAEAGNQKAEENSYGQILKSSSIIGGAQGINYLIAMVRTKFVAVLLGPSGVGLVGLYMSATSFVGAIAGMGIGSSGVREVAEAYGSGDNERVAQTIKVLRRACWATGLLGWMLTIALAWPLSLWTFGSGEHAWAIALLGATLLLGSISGGQSALLQGARRIGDLARLNVISVLAATVIAVGLYAWLRERGIVPVLITTAAVNIGFSWWFARRVPIASVAQSWMETWHQSKRLMGLGLAFMWSAFLTGSVALITRLLIVKELGLEANGVYQAAWGISGMFAGFILGAMGTDFYPHLTSVAHDNEQVNRLVNEQTEIGILLALPGLLGTLAFAPWIMHVFYSAKFHAGATLLPWFVLGIFGRVVSWPLGFILLAKGAFRWFAATETISNVFWILLTILLLRWCGLWGVALAFVILYGLTCAGMLWVTRRLTGFRWSLAALRLLLTSSGLIMANFSTQRWVPGVPGLAIGAVLSATACILSLRGIASRLGSNHRIVQIACKIPGVSFACSR